MCFTLLVVELVRPLISQRTKQAIQNTWSSHSHTATHSPLLPVSYNCGRFLLFTSISVMRIYFCPPNRLIQKNFMTWTLVALIKEMTLVLCGTGFIQCISWPQLCGSNVVTCFMTHAVIMRYTLSHTASKFCMKDSDLFWTRRDYSMSPRPCNISIWRIVKYLIPWMFRLHLSGLCLENETSQLNWSPLLVLIRCDKLRALLKLQ